jgi:unsaturated pyranuronate lyase
LFKFSDLKEEWLNPKLSRRMVVGEKAMLGYLVLLKDCIIPPHKHESEQISYIIKGALKFTINNEDTVVKEGEVLVIPSNVEHSAVAIEDTLDLDCFSPLRVDWITGQDQYLRR